MKLWQRYLFYRFFISFLFAWVILALLHLVLETFLNSHAAYFSFVLKNTLLLNFDFFTLIAFVFALLKTCYEWVQYKEALALQAAGLSTWQLFSPFFFVANGLFLLSILNHQYGIPTLSVHSSPFVFTGADKSTLIAHDQKGSLLQKVYWLKANGEVCYMDSLDIPIATHVYTFAQDQNGLLTRSSFQENVLFPTAITPEPPARYQPLLTLCEPVFFKILPLNIDSKESHTSPQHSSRTVSKRAHLYYKLSHSLFPLLVLLTMAGLFPQLFSKRRSFSLLAAYACAFIFLLWVSLDVLLAVTENQALAPEMAFAVWWLLVLLQTQRQLCR